MSRGERGRTSLAQRIALLSTAVAVITAILAGAIAVGLIRQANATNARRTLSRLADAAQATADIGANAAAGQQRARRTLAALKIQSATLTASSLGTSSPLVRSAVTKQDVNDVLGGASVSARRRLSNGQLVLIEARPTKAGGIALVQRQADATAVGDQAIRRLLLALLVGVVIAVLLGLLVAYRIARPLRRTAQAAQALSEGHRNVALTLQGPREVAEVSTAVNTLAAALSHSEARQREFLMSVSHDLRTPLTAIAGYAESLADGVIPPEEAQQVGAVLLSESQRLNRLVGDLLDLARLGAQDFRIDLTDVDLGELARSAQAVWNGRCASAGVAFRLELAHTPLRSTTDPGRVRQILDGLLENALRVTPAGAPIVLAVRPLYDGAVAGAAVLEVRDGGPGLSDADLSIAFDRSALYERYRGVREVGTGLGLAIVHGLVERLGGTVEAGHAPEGGARFTVTLPAGQPVGADVIAGR